MSHGIELRGAIEAELHPRSARFGRIFKPAKGTEFWPDVEALGRSGGPLDQPGHGPNNSLDNPSIPVAFTYLAQFIGHDITFDSTSNIERNKSAISARQALN